MSTKVSEINQLFANPAVESSRKELTQTKNVSVQFSNLLNQQSAGQSFTGVGKQLNTSDFSDYAQYQKKESSIREVTPVTLEEKASKIAEKMEAYGSAVKDVLKEELGVTEEEIESAMEALGFGYADLANQTNLAQLVSKLTGENMTDLLCNENFVTVMQQVSDVTEELLAELGMDIEEFNDICKLLMNPSEDAMQTEDESSLIQNPVAEEVQTEEFSQPVEQMSGENAKSASISQENKTTTSDEILFTEENAQEKKPVQVSVVHEEEDLKAEGEADETKEEATELPKESTLEQSSTKQQSGQQNSFNFSQGAENVAPQSQQTVNVEAPQGEFAQNYQQMVDIQDVMEQIVESARVTVSTGSTTMEMQLNPENLGKLYLEISTKEGVVSAKLVTQNEMVREALEAQMAELKQNLNQAGVKVDAVEVTVSSHEFERNLEQNGKQEEQFAGEREEQEQSGERRRRNLNLNSLDELSGMMSEEESLVAQMMQDNGNTMDMKA